MSAVFTDTSGLLALLNPEDDNHARAKAAFASLRVRRASLVSTSFVLVETGGASASRPSGGFARTSHR
jgi:predicted nucleic acid-binding protein